MGTGVIEIEIFSDVVCPWCFIGKRRLDKALAGELGTDVTLRWRPYQLHPAMPAEGLDRGEYLTRRYGAQAEPGRIPERIDAEARDEGIELRFDLMPRMPNTLLAHCLLEFGYAQGAQHELAEALFVGYFCEGRDVGAMNDLLAMAASVGLDTVAAQRYLEDGAGIEEVRAQLARAPELGNSGVPGYYLANAFLLPGAQTSEVMGQIISRVKAKLG
jgi:predicted DsbA family dithiol-disulfide isomerase